MVDATTRPFLSETLFHAFAWVVISYSAEQKTTGEPDPNRQTIQVIVRDSEGFPVENAEIRVDNLQGKVDGRRLTWDETTFGPSPTVFTDNTGMGVIRVPRLDSQGIEVGGAQLCVSHSHFVAIWQTVSTGKEPSLVELQPGLRIAANLIDSKTGVKVADDVHVIASRELFVRSWQQTDSGFLISKPLSIEKSWIRFVRLAPGQPTLFSELIWIDPTEGDRIMLRDIKMSAGTRVEGVLDASIPRPIRNGYVVAKIARRANEVPTNERPQDWVWFDETTITEDGHFMFESMPQEEVLQLIPICDDWVPQNPTIENVKDSFPDFDGNLEGSTTYPQLTRLIGPVVRPVLKMRRAADVSVLVVDTQGSQLTDQEIQMSPNQSWFDGGSSKLGHSRRTSERLTTERISKARPTYIDRYTTKTDIKGRAMIRGVPPTHGQEVFIFVKDHSAANSGPVQRVQVDLKPGVITEVTIKLQSEGTDVLKDEMFQGGKDD